MPDGAPRVVVDAYCLTDNSAARGIGTVVRHVLTGLGAHGELEMVAVAKPEANLPPGVARQPMRRRKLRPSLALVEHEWLLPRDLGRAAPDVVWSPATQPPRRSPAPFVQTLYDLNRLTLPYPLPARAARRWKRAAERMHHAARIVAISRASADQGIEHFGFDPKRMEVVHLGVGDEFRPEGPTERTAGGEPYLLFVGAWGPHKGYGEALSVIAALADLGYPHSLVMAGPQDAWMAARVSDAVAAAPRPDRVVVRGFVDDLPALYRGAAAYVCTSRGEGFGLPALEAMACGTPVVAFDNSSLPEVIGDAGVLVADGDVGAFVKAVRDVIDAPTLAAELRDAGPRRAAGFRWEDTVARYRDVFVAVAGSS